MFGNVTVDYVNDQFEIFYTPDHTDTEHLATVEPGDHGFSYELHGGPSFTQADYELLLENAEEQAAAYLDTDPNSIDLATGVAQFFPETTDDAVESAYKAARENKR